MIIQITDNILNKMQELEQGDDNQWLGKNMQK